MMLIVLSSSVLHVPIKHSHLFIIKHRYEIEGTAYLCEHLEKDAINFQCMVFHGLSYCNDWLAI